ncbi:MAG: helix-turn-helix transcriptional regulator [Bacteroides sp.]|nr:helix-turn-helix transcriptional regulator [Bacteroides sp.]
MQQYLFHIILLCICILSVPALAVTVTARGKFNPYDHESFSGIPSETLFEKGSDYLDLALTEPDSAMMCFSIIANRYEDTPTHTDASIAVSSLINISYLWRESYYDYARAYNALLKALKIAEDNNLESYLPYIYMGMGSVLQYVDIGDSPLESSFELLSKALQRAIATNNSSLMEYAIINLCEMAVTQGLTEAVTHDLNLIKNYSFTDSTANMDYINCFLNAIELLKTNDYNGMIQEFNRAITLTPSNKATDDKLTLLALKMKINTMKLAQQTDSIPIILNSMLSFANTQHYQEYILYALRELRDYYASIGNQKAAHEYDYRYLHINDSLQRQNNLSRVKDVAFISNLEEAQENVRRLTARKQQNEIIAICGGIVAIIVIIALLMHIRSQKKLHEANLALFDRFQNELNRPTLTMCAPDTINAEKTVPHSITESVEKEINNTPASGVSPEHAAEIFSKVKNVLESSREIYSDDFSIRSLANLINEPSYAVSAAINYCSGSNFKTLLLDYRLREACRRLSDNTNYSNQTIESVASGLGFKSRTYFISVFKKHTGLTPAVYMKIAHTKQETKADSDQNAV